MNQKMAMLAVESNVHVGRDEMPSRPTSRNLRHRGTARASIIIMEGFSTSKSLCREALQLWSGLPSVPSPRADEGSRHPPLRRFSSREGGYGRRDSSSSIMVVALKSRPTKNERPSCCSSIYQKAGHDSLHTGQLVRTFNQLAMHGAWNTCLQGVIA